MRTFKIADMWISIALITGCTVYFLGHQELETIIVCYFIVGGWQVVSMIVHAVSRTFTYRRGARYVYHWITFFSLITMPVGFAWVLVFTAPFMAVYYTWLCYHEVYVKMQRPLALLK